MTFETCLLRAAERAAELINSRHLDKWVEGAIRPSEMAFFLARCDAAGVERVIESGRQDGYSTEILTDWAKITDREVVSIDLELDTDRSLACRRRLQGKKVTLLKGSAYTCFGRESFLNFEKPTAFLVDGPKGWPALSMMSASLTRGTRLVAIHNLEVGLPTRELFLTLGGAQVFYEDALVEPGPIWHELIERERKFFLEHGAERELRRSSLGVLGLDGDAKEKFARMSGAQFGLHQPRIVRGFYRLGLFRATTKLYGLSYRLLGR